LIGIFAWHPWVKRTEVEWLTAYESWAQEIGHSVGAGATVVRTTCESTFDDQVGDPPKRELEPVAVAARRRCRKLSPARWDAGQSDVVRALTLAHASLASPQKRRDMSEIVHSSVGVRPDVYCWNPTAWSSLAEALAITRPGDETSVGGVADGAGNRVDLDPATCAELTRYVRGLRPTPLSNENLELAQALMLISHGAQHLKSPSASEAVVECDAIQRVRPLVMAAGWGPALASKIASHAWELAYPMLPARFRTPRCRDGGALDRNPQSSAWP
jgi:hypothetical protein